MIWNRTHSDAPSRTMPPPADHPCLQLTILPQLFYVVQKRSVDQDVLGLLQAAGRSGFFSVTRTSEEVSIVGEATEDMPADEAKWRCIKIAGPMEFGRAICSCAIVFAS